MAMHASWSPGIAFMPAESPSDTDEVNGVGWTNVVGLRRERRRDVPRQERNGQLVSHCRSRRRSSSRASAPSTVWVMCRVRRPNGPAGAEPGANLTDVHVWDGPNRIQKFGGKMLFGERHFNLNNTNVLFKLPATPEVFSESSSPCTSTFSEDQTVTFAAAGADSTRELLYDGLR